MTHLSARGTAWAAAILVTGCGAGLKEDLSAEGLDDPDDRTEQAKRHPRTLDRFIANAARDLEEDELAKPTARHLAANQDRGGEEGDDGDDPSRAEGPR